MEKILPNIAKFLGQPFGYSYPDKKTVAQLLDQNCKLSKNRNFNLLCTLSLSLFSIWQWSHSQFQACFL